MNSNLIYSILQYKHSLTLGEIINVGVLVYFPEDNHFQFAHGDGMKMNKAGEVMAVDKQDIFSSTKYRYSHYGHYHTDKVHDGPICRAESHRNIPPNNHWAYAHGYRRGPGTMKSITYHKNKGEISRQIYTI